MVDLGPIEGPVAVVADAHLGGPGGDGAELIAQIDALEPSDCSHVLFMGDLFHVWVGKPQYETDEITRFLPVLERARARGLHLSYVEGNRDFFIRSSVYAAHFDEVVDELRFELGQRHVLAVHGDGLNERDWRYLFWRWLSKSAPSRFFVGRVPRGLARRLVFGTEERLARSNFKHKDEIPEQVIRRFADAALEHPNSLLVLGHFHEPLELSVSQGEVILFNAWFRARELDWLRAGGAA